MSDQKTKNNHKLFESLPPHEAESFRDHLFIDYKGAVINGLDKYAVKMMLRILIKVGIIQPDDAAEMIRQIRRLMF